MGPLISCFWKRYMCIRVTTPPMLVNLWGKSSYICWNVLVVCCDGAALCCHLRVEEPFKTQPVSEWTSDLLIWKTLESWSEAQIREGRPSAAPTRCPGPVLSPYLASDAPPVLSKAETCLGKLLQSPKKVHGNVLGLENLTHHRVPFLELWETNFSFD